MGTTKKIRGYEAVNALIQFVKENINLTGYKLFAYQKDFDFDGDYIVFNHSYFSDDDEAVQEGTININVHNKTNIKGRIPFSTQNTIVDRIANKIDDLFLNGCYYDSRSVSSPLEDKDGTKYVNITIKVNYYNTI